MDIVQKECGTGIDKKLLMRKSKFERGENDAYNFGDGPEIVLKEDGTSIDKQLLKRKRAKSKDIKRPFDKHQSDHRLHSKIAFKFLLVVDKIDEDIDVLIQAIDKINGKLFLSGDERIVKDLVIHSPHFTVIDTRTSILSEVKTICKEVYKTKSDSTLVALVEKTFYETNVTGVISLLKLGFKRCIVGNDNVNNYLNELYQLISVKKPAFSENRNMEKALSVALNLCDDVFIITDSSYHCEFRNKACESYFNEKDVNGNESTEFFDLAGFKQMTLTLKQGKMWHGYLRIKNKKYLTKALPYIDKESNYFIIKMENEEFKMPQLDSGDVPTSKILHKNCWDTVMGSQQSSTLFKAKRLIKYAKKLANVQTYQILNVIEELISQPPEKKVYLNLNFDEFLTSSYVSAILSGQPTFSVYSDRTKNENIHINDLLKKSGEWEFDIIYFEKAARNCPARYLAMAIFKNFHMMKVLQCDEVTVYNWVNVVEKTYHSDIMYHNSTHAVDVMQAVAVFLNKEKLKNLLNPLEQIACLIASLTHDIDHPGRTNEFLINTKKQLAILYNDTSILEFHHACVTFQLTLGDEKINIFKNLSSDAYKKLRAQILNMILTTDLPKHFEHLKMFISTFCEGSPQVIRSPDIRLIQQMTLKCADVSNPARPLKLCIEWGLRLAEEYFVQTKEEKVLGLTTNLPLFVSGDCHSIPKSQMDFIGYIVNDMMRAWNTFIDMPELIYYLHTNYKKWSELKNKGYESLEQIRKILNSIKEK